MLARLFLLFTIVPVVELWLLLLVGRYVGFWPTVAGVVLTGMAGAFLGKREGLRVLDQWRRSLAAGRLPEEGVLSGVLVLVGGVLLVTPGVLTDVVGILLLVPASRRPIARWVRRYLEARIAAGTIHVIRPGRRAERPGPTGRAADQVIETRPVDDRDEPRQP